MVIRRDDENGGSYLMLNTAYERDERPNAADAARTAHHADTTFYFRCPDVDAAYHTLIARGCSVAPSEKTH